VKVANEFNCGILLTMKRVTAILMALLLVGLFTGCQLTHSVDWNKRIGTFTLDQAIIELGPPDMEAKLGDGRTVAKWISRYNNGGQVIFGGGYHAPLIATTPGYYESDLILTFTPNSVLQHWSRR